MNPLKQSLAIFLSLLLLGTTLPPDAQASAASFPLPAPQETYAPVPPKDMDALVAPIALYPDALVAQILGAATYPDQIEAADAFLQSNSGLSGDALIQAAQDQGEDWDPSVMALLQFPSVLDNLAQNLGWTSALGDVSANQQGDVMAAIQRMRAKASAAGNLKSGEQIKVVKESPDVIVIQPANPQVVYVPAYNPTVVYGGPIVTPGYSVGAVAATAMISFGVGITVGAMIGAPTCGWGYYGWRMNWAGGAVYCGGNPYYGNPYWWGGYYPGFRPGYRPHYYPPPRPPRPPPVGWRPPPPGSRPPYRPPGGTRPPGNGKPPNPGNGGGGRPPGGGGGRPPGGGGGKPPGGGGGGRPPGGGGGGKPPNPPPGGGGGRPPGGGGGKPTPGQPTTRPAPQPGGPSIQPVKPGVQPRPTTRPAPQNTRELRGYPSTNPPAKPAQKPNAFSGSGGGRPESARGNRSLNPSPKPANPPPQKAPAKAPSAPARPQAQPKSKR
jgi:hypothetical protein